MMTLTMMLLLQVLQISFGARVWPACQVEKYSYNSTSPFFVTLNVSFVHEASYWKTVTPILMAAQRRFQKALRHKIPSDALLSTVPRHPVSSLLFPKTAIYINITTANQLLSMDVDESYELLVGDALPNELESRHSQPQGIRILAPTVYGVMHGLQTLLQLVEYYYDHDDENDKDQEENKALLYSANSVVFNIRHTPIYIRDAPLYQHRGLLIDTSRHYLPWSLIYRNLQAMSLSKLNVLHWHLTDSQSWPFVSQAYPNLSKQGAFCETCIYSASNIQRIIRVAAMRGIRVVLEVDLPGHIQGTNWFVCAH
jgi:hexosaminidase